uniref:Uncharacterized protein n=1 Tax=Timema tahoe TaxID=61484 RepID=A0A7R9IUY5_9NEOP|nr:unnamed protein product [Timema tahoe]
MSCIAPVYRARTLGSFSRFRTRGTTFNKPSGTLRISTRNTCSSHQMKSSISLATS